MTLKGQRMTQTLRAISPQTILLVDDVATNLDVLLEHLQDLSCVLRVATSGEDALRLAANEPPDLILLDIMMPGMDGYEVLRRLKDDHATRNVPVIFVTAMSDSLDEARGLDMGAADFIAKPFIEPVLKARVKNHLELKRKTDLLEMLAHADGLTGVANRRQFDQLYRQEWLRCERRESPLSLVMIDVDHFKQYNDKYGHGQGDECLRRVAKALAEVVQRQGDLLARYGGEEFIALLPEASARDALRLAERMRDAIDALQLEHQHSSCANTVSVSIGIFSQVPTHHVSRADFLRAADRALYRAKMEGRNCVRVEFPLSAEGSMLRKSG